MSMPNYRAEGGGLRASNGGLDEGADRTFYDPYEPGMMGAYYERSTSGDWSIVEHAGYHTEHGLYLDGLNYLWTVPGSGFDRYPDTDEWVTFVFTVDEWASDDQLWFPAFGDPANEAHRGPAYEIQFIYNSETYRIQSRDGDDNRQDVATDAESNQAFDWLQEGETYAAGIRRKTSGEGSGVIGGLWEASADYPTQSEALAIIDSDDHPNPDGSGIAGLGPGDGPGRMGVRTGQSMSTQLHEIERAEESQ